MLVYNGFYLNMIKRGDFMEFFKDLKYIILCKCKDMFIIILKGLIDKGRCTVFIFYFVFSGRDYC